MVDGDTIDISPSVEGSSRVRLIGMDTPEVYFGKQPYGPEASAFATNASATLEASTRMLPEQLGVEVVEEQALY